MPVVVSDTAVFRELADEAGAGWRHLTGDGDDALPSAVEEARAPDRPRDAPGVRSRWDWVTIARTVNAVYAEVR